jgi:hypothetical protein
VDQGCAEVSHADDDASYCSVSTQGNGGCIASAAAFRDISPDRRVPAASVEAPLTLVTVHELESFLCQWLWYAQPMATVVLVRVQHEAALYEVR